MRRMLYLLTRGQNEGTSRLDGFKSNMGGFARSSDREEFYWVSPVLAEICSR